MFNRSLCVFVVCAAASAAGAACGSASAAPRPSTAKAAPSTSVAPAAAPAPASNPKKPMQQPSAEQLVREHFAKQSRPLLEVAPDAVETLGAAFWVRFEKGGGGLVLVRGSTVYAERGLPTITALLKADRFLTTRAISAADFLYLLEHLGELPELPADPFVENKVAALNPQWGFAKDSARFVIHSPNPKAAGPKRGAPRGDSSSVMRATLAIGADYALRWTTEETTVPR